MAKKIKDLIEILGEHVNLDEINPPEMLDEVESTEFSAGPVVDEGNMEVWLPAIALPIEKMFPNMPEAELERLRSALSLILTNHFGMTRDEVYGLLYAEGHRIFWH